MISIIASFLQGLDIIYPINTVIFVHRSETLVQPVERPPIICNQISEPLMGEFVHDSHDYLQFVSICVGNRRIQ